MESEAGLWPSRTRAVTRRFLFQMGRYVISRAPSGDSRKRDVLALSPGNQKFLKRFSRLHLRFRPPSSVGRPLTVLVSMCSSSSRYLWVSRSTGREAPAVREARGSTCNRYERTGLRGSRSVLRWEGFGLAFRGGRARGAQGVAPAVSAGSRIHPADLPSGSTRLGGSSRCASY